MEKLKITFLEDVVVDDVYRGTPSEESYKAGKTYALEEMSANRWLRRAKARRATSQNAAKPNKKAAADKKAVAARAKELADAQAAVEQVKEELEAATSDEDKTRLGEALQAATKKVATVEQAIADAGDGA